MNRLILGQADTRRDWDTVPYLNPDWRIWVTAIALSMVLGGLTVVASGRFGPVIPILALIGAGGALLAFVSLEVSLALLLGSAILFQTSILFQLSIPFLGGGLKPPDVLLLLVFAGFAVRWLLGNGRFPPLPPAMTLLVCGFLGWAILTAAFGVARGNAYKESLLELRPLLQYLLFIPIVLELSRAAIKRIIALVLGCATIMGVRAVILYAAGIGSDASYTIAGIRVMDFEFSYLLFATLLATALLLEGWRHRWLLLCVVAACLAGLTATFYRTAFLALFVSASFLVWGLSRLGRRRFAAIATAVGAIAAVAVPIALLEKPSLITPLVDLTTRMASIVEFGEDPSAVHRLREWRASAQLISEHPVIGNGLGTRVRFYSPMYDHEAHRLGYWSNDIYIHNSYVWIITKMGMVGIMIFAGMISVAALCGLRFLREAQPGDRRTLVLGLTACLLSLVVMGTLGPQFNAPGVSPFVGFILGALFVLTREDPNPSRQSGTS